MYCPSFKEQENDALWGDAKSGFASTATVCLRLRDDFSGGGLAAGDQSKPPDSARVPQGPEHGRYACGATLFGPGSPGGFDYFKARGE